MGYGGTILHKACYYGNNKKFNDIINSMISKYRDLNFYLGFINVPDYNGETPIYIAIRKNRIEMLRFLINNSADLTVKDKNGNTPFEFAIRNKFNDSVLVFTELTNLINQNLMWIANTFNNTVAITIMMSNAPSETRHKIVGQCKRDRMLAKLQNTMKSFNVRIPPNT
jgi:ankyrin repeat protein